MPPWAVADLARWSECLSTLLGRPITAQGMRVLGRQGSKAHGMTASAEVAFVDSDGTRSRCFVKWPDFSLYGQDLASDQWREAVWRLEGYQRFANHSRCHGIVRTSGDGRIEPIQMLDWGCVLIESSVPGQLYAERLSALATEPLESAVEDARSLCRHMVGLHGPVAGGSRRHYHRMLREWLIDMPLRVMDGSEEYWGERCEVRREIEHLLVDWRLRLLDSHERLRTVHHDFHPWNIFIDGSKVNLIGARTPGYGDAASDFAALMLNYVFFGYMSSPRFEGIYRRLYDAFRDEYFLLTDDDDLGTVLPAFFGSRLLIFLSPRYYPDLPVRVRESIQQLVLGVLRRSIDVLEPGALG